jgi:hypothetical protein
MLVRWHFFCLLSALILWVTAFQALAQGSTGGSLSNGETGGSGVYTAQIVISDHPHHVLVGHVIIVTRGTDTVRALVIQQRRDGVHRLHLREAWSGGIELPYRRTHGRGCTHGHCRDAPIGMIFLSGALFERAEVQGLIARLVGPSGAIDIAAPAALFRDASAM